LKQKNYHLGVAVWNTKYWLVSSSRGMIFYYKKKPQVSGEPPQGSIAGANVWSVETLDAHKGSFDVTFDDCHVLHLQIFSETKEKEKEKGMDAMTEKWVSAWKESIAEGRFSLPPKLSTLLSKLSPKSRGNMEIWQERLFVIDSSKKQIFYYAKKQSNDSQYTLVPLGTINFADIQSCDFATDKKRMHRFDIKLRRGKGKTKDKSKGRIFNLQADSAFLTRLWVKTVKSVSTPTSGATSDDEGEGTDMGSPSKNERDKEKDRDSDDDTREDDDD